VAQLALLPSITRTIQTARNRGLHFLKVHRCPRTSSGSKGAIEFEMVAIGGDNCVGEDHCRCWHSVYNVNVQPLRHSFVCTTPKSVTLLSPFSSSIPDDLPQKRNKGKSLLNSLSPSSLFSPPSSSCAWNPQSYPWSSAKASSGSINFGSRHVQGCSPLL